MRWLISLGAVAAITGCNDTGTEQPTAESVTTEVAFSIPNSSRNCSFDFGHLEPSDDQEGNLATPIQATARCLQAAGIENMNPEVAMVIESRIGANLTARGYDRGEAASYARRIVSDIDFALDFDRGEHSF